MIWVVHPESCFFTHPGSRIQGVKKALDPGSATLIEREKNFIVKLYADWVLSINWNTCILSSYVTYGIS
jgi:hypothetical protein